MDAIVLGRMEAEDRLELAITVMYTAKQFKKHLTELSEDTPDLDAVMEVQAALNLLFNDMLKIEAS